MTLASCGNVFTDLTAEAGKPKYSVTYDGNGAESGNVPADSGAYAQGSVVSILGNTGSLVKNGSDFVGWGTKSVYSDPDTYTLYNEGDALAMEGSGVTLYAVFLENFLGYPYVDGSGSITGINIVKKGCYSSGDSSGLAVHVGGGSGAYIVVQSMNYTVNGYTPNLGIYNQGSGYESSDAVTISR